jgi:hypothetical protein
MRLLQACAGEVGFPQNRALEVRVFQVRPSQDRAQQVGAVELRVFKIAPAQPSVIEERSTKVAIGQVEGIEPCIP